MTAQLKMDPINKNKEFQEQYREYLKAKIVKINMLLQNPYDMTSHQEYLNLLMMYSLFRKLFEVKDQERDTFKKIWQLQRICPIIIIYNNLKCCPGTFLDKVCPLKKPSKSLDPKELSSFLR
jgi:WASH complex subunit 7, N-terminal